jgi:hypothetical protein
MKQTTCLHCGDTYPDFDVAHVCSKGPYAPKLKPKMNERIGKLAVKAGAHWDHGDWNMPSAVYFSERDLEKFARLIVQDNIQTLRGNGYDDAAQCLQDIHFGIEDPV